MDKKVKWGIIGLGKIANKFATALAKVEDAELYAVASRSSQKAEVFAEIHNVPMAYATYEQIMEDKDIEVIYIATPHSLHHDNTLECLKNGKAVLCEKPLALTYNEASRMVKMARSNKVFLMEALWTAFLPHFQFAIKEIKSGKYGKVISLKSDFGFDAEFNRNQRLFNKALGGGSLMDIGIYNVFLAYSILGKPKKIDAVANFAETEVDLDCKIKFHYEEGVTADLFSTFEEKTPTIAEIELEKGKIILNSRFHEPTSLTIIRDGKKKTHDFDVKTNGYDFEAAHVTKLLKEGKTESPIMSLDKTLDIMEILDKIRKQIDLEY